MDDKRRFVIIGAGQAGRWLALTLRAEGFTGSIVWFGAEPHPPYDRPPLSKAALAGDTRLEQLRLFSADSFDRLCVDWRPGQTVEAIDRAARTVRTAAGNTIGYDTLFLATGGRARCWPGLSPHPRVLTLRTWEDAQTLKAQLATARRVLVLGGGWIGLEVAASARTQGCQVTVLEAAPRLCSRTVPACVSEHLAQRHRHEGVDLRLGTSVRSVGSDDAGVTVSLADGETLRGDLLVTGIGLIPHDELAAGCGLSIGNGVLTDERGRSSDPAIYAVGDVANTRRANGQYQRLESWENAQRQAVVAARDALGLPTDTQADGPPWFWSDQYDDNLQLLGEPEPAHEVVERHVPDKRQKLFFFLDGPRIRAAAAVNAGREIKLVRKWMRENRFPPRELLADPGLELAKLPLASPEKPVPLENPT